MLKFIKRKLIYLKGQMHGEFAMWCLNRDTNSTKDNRFYRWCRRQFNDHIIAFNELMEEYNITIYKD